MKIKIELDNQLTEDEVVIRCKDLTDDILAVQKKLVDAINLRQQLAVMKADAEVYLTLDEILFFETDDSFVAVHTNNQIYTTRSRLYELEELLPGNFMRVSKSTILNTSKIRSIHKNITGASEVEFLESQKKVFVSRNYFKVLMSKLEEKRLKK